jgi:arabinoxylan arabinofuranohydrolase
MLRGRAFLAAAVSGLVAESSANYVIFSQRFSADPAPIVHDGRVYLYTSHDKDHPHGYDMQDWNCLSSSDMVNWRDEGIAFSLQNTTWAQNMHAWAQQVVALPNGTFVMYFPAMGAGGGVGAGGSGALADATTEAAVS